MKLYSHIALLFSTTLFLPSVVHARRWRWGGGGGGNGGGGNSGGGGGNDGDVTLEDAKERDDLLFMREEEKMARDVYLTLYDQYGDSIFSNVASSEQTHMNRMLDMINRYGLTDPVDDNARGVFHDASIRELYQSLVADGAKSQLDAFMVGALIEEVDIRDLAQAMNDTDEAMLDRVYGNLRRASFNHLRAFVGRIEAMGIVYEAQHLSQDEVDDILGR